MWCSEPRHLQQLWTHHRSGGLGSSRVGRTMSSTIEAGFGCSASHVPSLDRGASQNRTMVQCDVQCDATTSLILACRVAGSATLGHAADNDERDALEAFGPVRRAIPRYRDGRRCRRIAWATDPRWHRSGRSPGSARAPLRRRRIAAIARARGRGARLLGRSGRGLRRTRGPPPRTGPPRPTPDPRAGARSVSED